MSADLLQLYSEDSVATWAERGIAVHEIDAKDLDEYAFGVIQLDTAGRVLSYNRYEEELARVSRDEVVGRNFFFDVAPCTRVRAFYGRFLEGVQAGNLHVTFEFVFDFEFGQRSVEITLMYRDVDETVWVLVR